MNQDMKLVQVCAECHTARCWYYEMPCGLARVADLELKTIKELKELGIENPEAWSDEKMKDVYGEPAPFGYKIDIKTGLQAGDKIRFGPKYCKDGAKDLEGQTIMLTTQYFEYDNGEYTEDQSCPGIHPEGWEDAASVYHLFGNNFENVADCVMIPATPEDLAKIAEIEAAENAAIAEQYADIGSYFQFIEDQEKITNDDDGIVLSFVTYEGLRKNNTSIKDVSTTMCPHDFGLPDWEGCNEDASCHEQCWMRPMPKQEAEAYEPGMEECCLDYLADIAAEMNQDDDPKYTVCSKCGRYAKTFYDRNWQMSIYVDAEEAFGLVEREENNE